MKNSTEKWIKSNASEKELLVRKKFLKCFREWEIPDNEIFSHFNLFVDRRLFSHMLFLNELYEHMLGVHGIIMEFGVRWGRNLASFEALRGIYEPFNFNRKIVGFDTFAGFPNVHEKDGSANIIKEGSYGVTENYQEFLSNVLDCHEELSLFSHIKQYELVSGDATTTIKDYLNKHPETIISLAYFDFDIYEPTQACLAAIKPHLTKGSVIGFDEINSHEYPGETIALKEVFGLDKYKIRHSKYSTSRSYIVIE